MTDKRVEHIESRGGEGVFPQNWYDDVAWRKVTMVTILLPFKMGIILEVNRTPLFAPCSPLVRPLLTPVTILDQDHGPPQLVLWSGSSGL